MCAAGLRQLSVTGVTVFDTASDPRFAKIATWLHAQDAVKVWKGSLGSLKASRFTTDSELMQAFVGTQGMRALTGCLAKMCHVCAAAMLGPGTSALILQPPKNGRTSQQFRD